MVTRAGDLPRAEQSAATVLIEEVEKRTGIRLHQSTSWPAGKVVIAITSQTNVPGWGRKLPQRAGAGLPETRAEGYRIWVEDGKTVWVIGAERAGPCSASANSCAAWTGRAASLRSRARWTWRPRRLPSAAIS